MELLFRNASLFKVYFHLKTTATEVFEVQLNFFSYFMKKSFSFLEIFIFLYFNSFIKEGLNDIETSVMIEFNHSVSTFLNIYLLNLKAFGYETWPNNRYSRWYNF